MVFTSKHHDLDDSILDCVPTQIFDQMNTGLARKVTEEEVRNATFQPGETQTPGLNTDARARHFFGVVLSTKLEHSRTRCIHCGKSLS